ncbi:cupin domain-containing protein [Gordonia sp. HNM0687]|uniref:Cupin domain-containing protein n=1 Tax=Gordonia mangrovi TaxID=2665643 RepID=A0A6L7GND6_9ACTN|nr:cupin domain-containing protein [Gordonia mangrovi]MXP20877.1 cupin domain-containing protein [Gordonia mangrovi]UVF78570.1 cupin domain-containing protein [Gordonia mangrovi]
MSENILPEWARDLGLVAHPEGGWYRETWRSPVRIPADVLPPGYSAERPVATAILFLLLPGEQSAWHTVRSAELWLYHRGSAVLLELGGDGDQPAAPTEIHVGADISAGQTPQAVVPPGVWQRARPLGDEPVLVSCVVSPGFDFADFRLAAPDA